MSVVNVLVALAPYVFQLLGMIPGFEKTIEQFRADISGNSNLTDAQKATALRQAEVDVDAADDEVQAAVAADLDVPAAKPTAPG